MHTYFKKTREKYVICLIGKCFSLVKMYFTKAQNYQNFIEAFFCKKYIRIQNIPKTTRFIIVFRRIFYKHTISLTKTKEYRSLPKAISKGNHRGFLMKRNKFRRKNKVKLLKYKGNHRVFSYQTMLLVRKMHSPYYEIHQFEAPNRTTSEFLVTTSGSSKSK